MVKEIIMTSKEKLVAEAVELGLGEETFLKSLKEENLNTMIVAVKVRDSKITDQQKVISSGKKSAKNENVTSVADLVKGSKITVNPVKGK
jgi:hypothetical protein